MIEYTRRAGSALHQWSCSELELTEERDLSRGVFEPFSRSEDFVGEIEAAFCAVAAAAIAAICSIGFIPASTIVICGTIPGPPNPFPFPPEIIGAVSCSSTT